ncbi:MAG: PD-(D/E)XK nuclease family protein, partial [bacterium]
AEIQHAGRALKIDNIDRPVIGNEYTGILSEKFAKPLANRFTTLSVSAILSYANCPFSFFGERCLRIKELEDVEESIQPNVAGTILHNVLDSFYSERMDAVFGEIREIDRRISLLVENYDSIASRICVTSMNAESARSRIIELAEEAIEKHSDACPNRLAFETMSVILKAGFDSYIDSVLDDTSFVPVDIEKEFHREIEGVKVRGKADRVDSNSSGQLRIIDYKWGDSFTPAKIKSGEAMQLPLYAILLGGDVVSLGYISDFKKQAPNFGSFVTRSEDCGGLYIGKEGWDDMIANTLETTKVIIRLILAGHFPPTVNPSGCRSQKYCPFVEICSAEKVVSIPEVEE